PTSIFGTCEPGCVWICVARCRVSGPVRHAPPRCGPSLTTSSSLNKHSSGAAPARCNVPRDRKC
ncbi:hypothetical protein BaRGS_00007087, partial [Batillaria attramentaria]